MKFTFYSTFPFFLHSTHKAGEGERKSRNSTARLRMVFIMLGNFNLAMCVRYDLSHV